MFRQKLRDSLRHIGEALREPEQFALRWHQNGDVYPVWVFAALALTAIVGTTTYGMTMGLLGGADRMLVCGLACTTAAGIAWSLPLPALYILNSLTGSRLRPSTTFLAALVTTSWGGLAMIASIPINLFFSTALPFPIPVLLVNLVVFAGVGVSMIDVFGRVMQKLEPARGRSPVVWLALVGAIGAELFYAFGLFQFSAA
ncbi:MAG: hypothetical protein L0Y72_29495 [Gemmataceae bacterium]|nr:hypothetical protein [Gemmataceae bacterium]MCI0743182.1 hypothetical protein [Gemmataceae bacterium]